MGRTHTATASVSGQCRGAAGERWQSGALYEPLDGALFFAGGRPSHVIV